MFNTITWEQYFTAVTILLVCYYVFIGFKFYRWEILSIIGIKKVDDSTNAITTVANLKKSFQTESHEDYLPRPAVNKDISTVFQSFADEIKAYLQESDHNITKKALLQSMQGIVMKYPVLKTAEYDPELAQFLFEESDAKYPTLLQLNDVKQLLV